MNTQTTPSLAQSRFRDIIATENVHGRFRQLDVRLSNPGDAVTKVKVALLLSIQTILRQVIKILPD